MQIYKYIYMCFENYRAQVLFLALKTLKESGYEHVYDAVEKPLQFAQTGAVLEVLITTTT